MPAFLTVSERVAIRADLVTDVLLLDKNTVKGTPDFARMVGPYAVGLTAIRPDGRQIPMPIKDGLEFDEASLLFARVTEALGSDKNADVREMLPTAEDAT